MLSFEEKKETITDHIILKYTGVGDCVIIEHFKFDFLSRQWEEEDHWYQPVKENSTDVRSTGFPGPAIDEVKKWIDTL